MSTSPTRSPPARHHGASFETRVWLRMLACGNRIEAALRKRLRAEFDSTLARFDILVEIARPPTGPTMGELSRRLMVTKGNITDLMGRLEAEKLVERRRDPGDARVQQVFLTTRGKRLVQAMLPAHDAWLAELMRDVPADDLESLHAILGRMREALPDPSE